MRCPPPLATWPGGSPAWTAGCPLCSALCCSWWPCWLSAASKSPLWRRKPPKPQLVERNDTSAAVCRRSFCAAFWSKLIFCQQITHNFLVHRRDICYNKIKMKLGGMYRAQSSNTACRLPAPGAEHGQRTREIHGESALSPTSTYPGKEDSLWHGKKQNPQRRNQPHQGCCPPPLWSPLPLKQRPLLRRKPLWRRKPLLPRRRLPLLRRRKRPLPRRRPLWRRKPLLMWRRLPPAPGEERGRSQEGGPCRGESRSRRGEGCSCPGEERGCSQEGSPCGGESSSRRGEGCPPPRRKKRLLLKRPLPPKRRQPPSWRSPPL